MDSLKTIEELETLATEAWETYEEIKELGRQKTAKQEHLDKLERRIINYLEEHDKDCLEAPRGKFYATRREVYSWAALSPEQKADVLAKFKARGDDFYNSVVTLNYQTINSICKHEKEYLRSQGLDDKPFGVFESKEQVYLNYKSK